MFYSIAEVSQITGISPYNLRFYERKGIIPPPPRDGAGYRQYGEVELAHIMGLLCLKHSGMQLEGITRFFDMIKEGEKTLPERLDMLKSTRESVRQRIKKLEKCLLYVDDKIEYYEDCCRHYDAGKDIPEYDMEIINRIFPEKKEELSCPMTSGKTAGRG